MAKIVILKQKLLKLLMYVILFSSVSSSCYAFVCSFYNHDFSVTQTIEHLMKGW
jgi:hypothetical protein